ncbi:MAG: S9 family peptidase [Tannerellaceae bacterium]|jgi:dipeptidyl aminopeptidase/acylaminoacyl peptidase|nr:S9 family peptidase [Tannerellaceae bacterium]
MKTHAVLLLTALLCCSSSGLLSSQVTRGDYDRIDTLLKRSERVYSSFVVPHWEGDSSTFWYTNQERGGKVSYRVDAATGHKQPIPLREEPPTPTPPAPRPSHRDTAKIPSPDNRWEAYVQDYNLYVRPLGDASGAVALSVDGTEQHYYSARIRWSPDSRKLVTLRIRDAAERQIPLLESSPSNRRQPLLHWRDYVKPGDPLDVALPALFDRETLRAIPLGDTELYARQFSLRLTEWRKDSRAFTFEFNQRGHQRYIVAEADAATGLIRHLVDEQSPTFIYYNNLYRHDLEDGKEMLWISERDGWRHLYLMDGKTGNVKRQITRGEWVVRNVEHVDESEGVIYFYASGLHPGEDPYNRHYCRIGLDGKGFRDLTPENANHKVTPSKNRRYFVDVYSRPDLPPVSQVKRMPEGDPVAVVERCDVSDLEDNEGWRMPEVFHAKGRDGHTDIWGNIHRPSHFDASKSYPVIEFIYAGPHDAHVDKDFKPAHHLVSRLVDLGFIVVSIDGMGTANRSKAFHDVCWKNLKDAGFPDRKQWIRAAAEKYPSMDIRNVGIYGWSAGGQNAMAALLFHNDFYKVAVAFCGCHDNRMDKIWWNEQWMGYPVDEAYSASSNVDNAALLKGKLLLVNGELDENVDPASTLQVVHALIRAGKNFEQLYLPAKGHSLAGKFEMHRLHDFFVKHLLQQDPPEWSEE